MPHANDAGCVEPIADGSDRMRPICRIDIVGINGHPYEWMESRCHEYGGDKNRTGLDSVVSFSQAGVLNLCPIQVCPKGIGERSVMGRMYYEGRLVLEAAITSS